MPIKDKFIEYKCPRCGEIRQPVSRENQYLGPMDRVIKCNSCEIRWRTQTGFNRPEGIVFFGKQNQDELNLIKKELFG